MAKTVCILEKVHCMIFSCQSRELKVRFFLNNVIVRKNVYSFNVKIMIVKHNIVCRVNCKDLFKRVLIK